MDDKDFDPGGQATTTTIALTPVLILAPAWLLFHQRVTWLEVVGACISVIGVALFFV